MIVLDTCALLYDALTPDRLTEAARSAIERADTAGQLACCDISLWEIAMLAARGRIDPGTDVASFLHLALSARSTHVLPLTPEIAALSVSLGLHGDPADRLIAATTVHHGAQLVTSDQRLRDVPGVPTIW
jgi:PIN domain nuclease of toxin-antitoxin system